MTLSAYEEEVFALIVAEVETDHRWQRVRRVFLAVGGAILALALVLLPRHAGWLPTLVFAGSYAVGAVVVLIMGPRLFRHPPAPRQWPLRW